jgi:hypothetical protein
VVTTQQRNMMAPCEGLEGLNDLKNYTIKWYINNLTCLNCVKKMLAPNNAGTQPLSFVCSNWQIPLVVVHGPVPFIPHFK